jgi:class 3 adenylate cyclase
VARVSLPDDPTLAEVARAIEHGGIAGDILDRQFRLVWASPGLREIIGEEDEERLGYGRHIVDVCHSDAWVAAFGIETIRQIASATAPYWIASAEGRRAIEQYPDLGLDRRDVEPLPLPPIWAITFELRKGDGTPPSSVNALGIRIQDAQGTVVGALETFSSGLPPQILWLLVRGDERLFERMARLVTPGKRQAALLFGDLEASSKLSRRLPTATYFDLISRLTTRFDEEVIESKGVLGKHAGDGVTAFFLVDDLGSPSRAARAAIETARALKAATADIAAGMDSLAPDSCRLNVGLHWGPTVYLGQVATSGRLEVTALGDEVNEAARIQESARHGQTLASKLVIEQLDEDDASELDIDMTSVSYRPIVELDAPPKAVRDAGVVAVASI